MANIIPMAGLGSRFSAEGYDVPKPLITVSGEPMIIQVIRRLPSSDKWIFLVRQEHIDRYQLDKIIIKEIPEAIIVGINRTTSGQATTCLLAQAYVDPEEPILIGACDAVCLIDEEKHRRLITDQRNDCVVWTCTKFERMRQMPHLYGWVRLADDCETIVGMSVKVPISTNPYQDHGVVATFNFRKSSEFFEAVNLMIKNNYAVNGEYYVDTVPIFLSEMQKRSIIFDVNKVLSWGTPGELKEYELWEERFRSRGYRPSNDLEKQQYLYWKEVFE